MTAPYSNDIGRRIATEKMIIRHMLMKLSKAGWWLCGVHDGEEHYPTIDTAKALEHVFSVDDSTIYVEGPGGKRNWIRIILGNDFDVISDYGYTEPFDAIMTSVGKWCEGLFTDGEMPKS